MTVILITLGLFALLWVALLLSPAHRAGYKNALDAATVLPDPPSWPAVTIIVPARNEAKIMPETVPTMCSQDYPGLSVVLVNDQSDDDSAVVLAAIGKDHANLLVVDGAARPEGWCGKPWAVMQGVDRAATPWLCFTDADMFFHPLAVRQAMRLANRDGYDMVSLFPTLIFTSELEKIGMAGLMTIIGLIFPPGKANDPRSKVALAAGGFILVRREVYDKIGGHEAVKAEIIDDVNLAKKLKESGARTHSRLTNDLTSTRMYEDFNDLWEGLSKNAYAGMEYQPRKFWAGLIFGLLFVVLPPAYVIVGLLWMVKAHSPRSVLFAAIAAVMWSAQCLMHRRTVRFMRLPWWHTFLMPVSIALYGAIASHSAWQHHFGGGTMWKGRKYAKPGS
ncbi:MAG: glycosyltransferase [Tepidisphaeraceae bacterium]|jgi:hopene-associated glycosyltransferase HpnB